MKNVVQPFISDELSNKTWYDNGQLNWLHQNPGTTQLVQSYRIFAI